MKIQAEHITNSFRGYKNIISHSLLDSSGENSYAVMAMKLNNEDGHEDLNAWKEIQKKLNPKAELSDYIVFQNTNIFEKDLFMVDDYLLDLNDDFIVENELRKKENVMLKANTLAASLTKRIMNNIFSVEDNELYKTAIAAYKVLEKSLSAEVANSLILVEAALKRVKHNVTAKLINDAISRNMAKFFK